MRRRDERVEVYSKVAFRCTRSARTSTTACRGEDDVRQDRRGSINKGEITPEGCEGAQATTALGEQDRLPLRRRTRSFGLPRAGGRQADREGSRPGAPAPVAAGWTGGLVVVACGRGAGNARGGDYVSTSRVPRRVRRVQVESLEQR